VSDVAPLNPELLLRTLKSHKVKFVLIGALAARLYGFPRLTADADITPAIDDANIERLAKALKELDARVYTESVPEGLAFDCSPAALRRASMWNLVTSAGRIDIAFKPSGTEGFDELSKEAEKFTAYGVTFLAASIDDIIKSKEASGRPKDRDDALILRAIRKKERSR
jgi:hypothetical protein